MACPLSIVFLGMTHWDCVSELCVPDYDQGSECPPPPNRCPLATHWDCHLRRCVTIQETASCPPPAQKCQLGKHWNCHSEECVSHDRHLPRDILETIKINQHYVASSHLVISSPETESCVTIDQARLTQLARYSTTPAPPSHSRLSLKLHLRTGTGTRHMSPGSISSVFLSV